VPWRGWPDGSAPGGMRGATGALAIFPQPFASSTEPLRSTTRTAAPRCSIDTGSVSPAGGVPRWPVPFLTLVLRRDRFSGIPRDLSSPSPPRSSRDGRRVTRQYMDVASSRKDRACDKDLTDDGGASVRRGYISAARRR